jgi:8-oxo-dGTP pyrophosphatase MutT (NUDIX family)
MNKPKFNNIPNEHIIIRYESNTKITTLDYWVSRSVAVVGVVFARTLIGGVHVLITKRAKEMPDEPGKCCMPCGYLDWGENGHEAMIREVYEETSLYLPDYEKYLINNYHKKPVGIHDEPTRDKRQNISMAYLSVYDFSKAMDQFPTNIQDFTDKEVAQVIWMPLTDFYSKYERVYEWAFHHDETLKEVINFYRGI